MAVAHQPTATTPRRRARRAQGGWPTQAELHAFSPVVRLLSSLWSLAAVRRLGVAMDAAYVDVWVIIDDEDLDAERDISAIERQYRVNGLPDGHSFALHVVPLQRIDPDLLPAFETILER